MQLHTDGTELLLEVLPLLTLLFVLAFDCNVDLILAGSDPDALVRTLQSSL